MKISRRAFVASGIAFGALDDNVLKAENTMLSFDKNQKDNSDLPGKKHLLVDAEQISKLHNLEFKAHPAKKRQAPVIIADMPWEQGLVDGKLDKRVYIYGTVLFDENKREFRMWYNRDESVLFASSNDGINWQKPIVNAKENNNILNLKMHSPSIIYDKLEKDPKKRYKAIGSRRAFDKGEISRLKEKFYFSDFYKDRLNRLYIAAYSEDGLNWTHYDEPALLSCDTITLAQDQETGEYLAFHKREGDFRVKGRQIFLSVSRDMINWSEPKLVLQTDEVDHAAAKALEGGTHSEFYNMSVFHYANQWMGLVTVFHRTGLPKNSGPGQNLADGPADIQLTTSRDGRHWERSWDRSPIIPIGPNKYDGGTILGVTNTPVLVNDEMWMYYAAMTTTHGGAFPEKEFSIGVASWRIDGMGSVRPKVGGGYFETTPLFVNGGQLFVNGDFSKGELEVELIDVNGKTVPGYGKNECKIVNKDSINAPVLWKGQNLPKLNRLVKIRFLLENGDLFSYTIK